MRLFLFIVFLSSLAWSNDQENLRFLDLKQQAAFKSTDAFLNRLGFEDFVAQIKKNQDQAQQISAVSKLALERSSMYLQSVNGARNLANLTAAVLATTEDLKTLELIKLIIIQQLSPFPLLTSEPLGEKQILEIKKGSVSDAIEAKKVLMSSRAGERFFTEKLNLIKAYLILLKPKPENKKEVVAWLDSVITDAIIDPYTVQKRQQNRFLGRALVVTLVQYYRAQKNTLAELQLKQLLRQHKLYIENYVNAYYVTEIENGDIRGVDLKSGDTALEYSHGQEAFFTSLLIQPQNSENRDTSKKYQLTNSVLDAYHFLDTDKYYAILDKKDTYRQLSPKEEQIYNDFWNKNYAKGFSHSGHVEVRKDEASQIAVAWVWDIYPEKDKIGPVRLMSPEGFSYPERMLKVGFLRNSPEKLLASFKKQISTRGYLSNIWTGYKSYVGRYDDGQMGPSIDTESRSVWPTQVSETQVMAWTKYSSGDAKKWYQTEILPRVFARLKDYLVSSKAKLFADGLVSAEDMLYCSQLIEVAYLEAANLDLQTSPDQIWEVLKYLNKSISNTLKLNLNDRLVSPNGLVWQSDVVERLETFYLNRDRVKLQEIKTNPTVASDYTNFLSLFPEVKTTVIDNEKKLLSIKDDYIQLDLEN